MPKSDYVKIAELVNQRMKPNARYNKYVTIQLTTVDTNLSSLISNHIYYINRCRNKNYQQDEDTERYETTFQALKSYVEEKITSKAWQIEAIRNKWSPPDKIVSRADVIEECAKIVEDMVVECPYNHGSKCYFSDIAYVLRSNK